MDVYNVHNGSYIVPKTNDLELESMGFYNGNKFMLYFHLNGHRNGNKSRVYIATI